MSFIAHQHVIVEFDGVDAAGFLQSQLTNDVAALAIGQWQWQGYCNAKGRLHATFALVRTGELTYMAVVHESVVAFLVKRLTMFRLRSKLSISQNATLFVGHHFAPPTQLDHVVATLDLQHGRWVTIESSQNNLGTASHKQMAQWQVIGIQSKQPEIVAETNEMFVPQMIGFDSLTPSSGVSFTKGCYPGQEIVARAHYRGAVKRGVAVANLDRSTGLAPGSELEWGDGGVATIVSVAPDEHDAIALLVVPLAT